MQKYFLAFANLLFLPALYVLITFGLVYTFYVLDGFDVGITIGEACGAEGLYGFPLMLRGHDYSNVKGAFICPYGLQQLIANLLNLLFLISISAGLTFLIKRKLT